MLFDLAPVSRAIFELVNATQVKPARAPLNGPIIRAPPGAMKWYDRGGGAGGRRNFPLCPGGPPGALIGPRGQRGKGKGPKGGRVGSFAHGLKSPAFFPGGSPGGFRCRGEEGAPAWGFGDAFPPSRGPGGVLSGYAWIGDAINLKGRRPPGPGRADGPRGGPAPRG